MHHLLFSADFQNNPERHQFKLKALIFFILKNHPSTEIRGLHTSPKGIANLHIFKPGQNYFTKKNRQV